MLAQKPASHEPVSGAIVRRRTRRLPPRPSARRRRLTSADWRLLAAAALAQVVAAAALRAMPLRRLRAGASRIRRVTQFMITGSDDRIIWAIEATGRRLGRLSSCLIRALVAELLIDSKGGPTCLKIGVRRTAGTIAAHAWLERDDRVLMGATTDEYLPLVHWKSPSA